MSKVGAGVLALAVVWLISTPGFGVFLVAIGVLAYIGQLIGQNSVTLMIYIIAAMAVSYLLPFVMAFYHKQVRWILIVPAVATVVFAVTSSLIAYAGCRAGNQAAIQAMRAIPLLWGFELTLVPKEQWLSCTFFS